MYPVMLDVKDRLCLVVGGGGVAVRKVQGLRTEGAQVTVVALEPADSLIQLAKRRLITLEQREYRDGEARDYALVFAATDDRATNQRVFEDARSADIWVNVADDPEFCSFHLPARVQRGPLQLAIASHGEAPFVVRRLRQALEQRFGPEWAEWLEAAARFRQAVRTSDLSQPDRERTYDRFFSSTVDPRRLTARVPTDDEVARWLTGVAPKPSTEAPAPRGDTKLLQREGFVSLIGGGPGDPGLLTVKGRQRLLAADAVAYDRLAATALPCEIRPEVELHCVGKTAGQHPVPQEQITALLIRLAREGKHVARLKGGDPFVFGRGGEEAEALREAGVPFEVVPSVTAGIAAPAYAGIPVTHRKEVVRVTMVTAHEAVKRGGPQVRWDLLASDPHATILGYMGVTSLPKVVDELLASAIDPKTPAAMIERGTTCRQRVVRAPLDELPAAVKKSNIKPPALFVIGPAVRHADTLQWFSTRPLFGQRLGIFQHTRSTELVEALQLNGAEVIETPQPLTPAARVVIGSLPLTGWVLRDADEVDAVEDERDGPGWSPEVVAWCLCPQAAARARELRWERVEQTDPDSLLEVLARKPRPVS